MADENVIQPVTPTEPAQAPVSTPVVEIPATETTPAPISPTEPVPAPVAEPVPVVEPTPAPESVKPAVEEPEIEITPTSPKGDGQAEPDQAQIIYKEDPGIIRRLLDKAKSKIQERKRKKLDKIMSLFSILPQVTNKDVQKSLRVIKRTATRYLDQLEKEGKITQVGKTGKSVIYTRRQ